MISLSIMIGQLTGEPNPFEHQPKSRLIMSDNEVLVEDGLSGNARRTEARILTSMARIRQWEGSSYTDGFSTNEVERNCGCGMRIAREAIGRMLVSGELVKLKATRNGAPLFRKANYGQIDAMDTTSEIESLRNQNAALEESNQALAKRGAFLEHENRELRDRLSGRGFE